MMELPKRHATPREGWPVRTHIVYLVLLIAYASSIWNKHCKWIIYGSDGLGSKL
jgi:hypothetical protein